MSCLCLYKFSIAPDWNIKYVSSGFIVTVYTALEYLLFNELSVKELSIEKQLNILVIIKVWHWLTTHKILD